MPKTEVMVRVLYPTAFEALGVDVEGLEEVSVTAEIAATLIGSGWAESVAPKRTTKTETV